MSLLFDGKNTKVQQLAEYIKNAIATNELKVGEATLNQPFEPSVLRFKRHRI